MAFQFGFAAEDGDDIATNGEVPVHAPQPSVNEQNSVNAVPVHEHSLEELVGRPIFIPRRDSPHHSRPGGQAMHGRPSMAKGHLEGLIDFLSPYSLILSMF